MKTTLLLIIFFASSAFAGSKVKVDVGLTPAGSFTAESSKFKGKLIKEKAEFSAKKIEVLIKTLKTGIDLRDEHLWDYLNYKTTPKATLTNLKASNGKGSADLEVNGVKRTVTISYIEQGQEVLARLTVKASDFKLAPKSYLGVGVEDEVIISAQIEFKQKK